MATPSNQIHWLRRIETRSLSRHVVFRGCFQPNPLTQKDWNNLGNPVHKPAARLPTKSIDSEGLKQILGVIFIVAGFLPTKSIDSEGLKLRTDNRSDITQSSSNQIHWLRRIETRYVPLKRFKKMLLPTKSIDSEGLKLSQPNQLFQNETLPTKSIDSEGLKLPIKHDLLPRMESSKQIH